MNNKAKDNKWYIIYTKSSQLKEEWMKAFERERVRVLEDADKGELYSVIATSAILFILQAEKPRACHHMEL